MKKNSDKKKIVFQFYEASVTDNTINFIYQDLCMQCLIDLREKDFSTYNKTEFTAYDYKKMCIRAEQQRKYYDVCSAIFTMGEWQAKYLIEKCGVNKNKVFSVGGGVNVDVTKYNPKNRNHKRILFVGRNFERKGGALVIEAFKQLKTKYVNDAELYVVGGGVHKYKYVEGVQFLGDICSSEIVDYYNFCDVFCMPSYFEAYGIAFIEALCFGMPCIGRNCNEMPYLIQEGRNGYLIENDNIDILCEKMFLALNNTEIFGFLEQNRDNYIKKYSWKNVVNKIAEIIDKKVETNVER